MISNCGKDERGKYTGGQAGDQTGKEWEIRTWYNYPWTHVIRPKDPNVAKKLVTKSKNAAKNDNVGYDQGQRLTYYNALKEANWKPVEIKKKCEADCSAGTLANLIAVGHEVKNERLMKLNPNGTTSTILDQISKSDFEILTDKKYLTSDEYLLDGDILLAKGHHVCVNLTDGAKVAKKSTTTTTSSTSIPKLASANPNLNKGSKGTQVSYLQKDLNYLGFKDKNEKKLVVDGDFGTNTEYALKAFQKKHSLSVDGIYGEKSHAKMKKVLV